MSVITVSREYGSLGDQIAKDVAERVGYDYFDKEVLNDAVSAEEIKHIAEEDNGNRVHKHIRELLPGLSRRMGLPYFFTHNSNKKSTWQFDEILEKCEAIPDASAVMDDMQFLIESLWNRKNIVIVGRGGQNILALKPDAIHLRIMGSLEDRCKRVMKHEKLSRESALTKIKLMDRLSACFFRHYFGAEWDDPNLYHLVLNTSFTSREQAAEIILSALTHNKRAETI